MPYDSLEQQEDDMDRDKYQCRICGYVYDPCLGDPENRCPPGTEYTRLPHEWGCPQCGASKGEFEKMYREVHAQ